MRICFPFCQRRWPENHCTFLYRLINDNTNYVSVWWFNRANTSQTPNTPWTGYRGVHKSWWCQRAPWMSWPTQANSSCPSRKPLRRAAHWPEAQPAAASIMVWLMHYILLFEYEYTSIARSHMRHIPNLGNYTIKKILQTRNCLSTDSQLTSLWWQYNGGKA